MAVNTLLWQNLGQSKLSSFLLLVKWRIPSSLTFMLIGLLDATVANGLLVGGRRQRAYIYSRRRRCRRRRRRRRREGSRMQRGRRKQR